MRVTVDDTLAESLQQAVPNKPIDTLVDFQLRRFASVAPTERILVLRQADRQAIESILGGTIETAEQLLEAIQRHAQITLGGVQIDFTPAQRREIERRARKNQRSPEEELRSIAQETTKLMLDEA